MGKLDGKVAVITGGSSGMALATAKLFVEEGACVFITGRRQEALDEAVKLIGRNVTAVPKQSGTKPGREGRKEAGGLATVLPEGTRLQGT